MTDNPIVFPDEDSGDLAAAISTPSRSPSPPTRSRWRCAKSARSRERRIAVLVDPKMSGLPPFLTEDAGVNSGLMIPQVTAAALVSENKSLAFPASVDSIPTSAGQEDHVSMAPIAARKARQIARNAAGVIAIELIAAAQGIDYHAPLKTSRKAASGPRQGARALAAPRRRPLLGRRNGRASGGGAGRGNRRRSDRAQLTRVQRCSLHKNIPASAQPRTSIASGPTRRIVAGARMLRLGSNAWPLNGAVARGPHAREDAGADQVRRAAPARGAPWPCPTRR